jgi:hypothetical protein
MTPLWQKCVIISCVCVCVSVCLSVCLSGGRLPVNCTRHETAIILVMVTNTDIHIVAVWTRVQGEATGQLGGAQVVPRPTEATRKNTHPIYRERARSSSSRNSALSWGLRLGELRGHLGLAQKDYAQNRSVYVCVRLRIDRERSPPLLGTSYLAFHIFHLIVPCEFFSMLGGRLKFYSCVKI